MDAIVTGVTAIVASLGGLLVGSRLQLRRDIQDLRRERYVSWIKWMDRLPYRAWEAALEDQTGTKYRDALEIDLVEITSEVEFYASKQVGKRWQELRKKLGSGSILTRFRKEAKAGTDARQRLVTIHQQEIADERIALIQEMREEVSLPLS